MLVVGHRLTVGNLRYETHAAALVLRRGVLPIVDRLEVAVPRAVSVKATAGDDVRLSLDAGEGAADVFTGTVAGVRRDLRVTSIVARGAAHALARYRPSLSLEQVTVGDVISGLCDDAGVDTDTVDAGPTLARYIASARSSALDEVVRLAGLIGATPTVTASNALRVAAAPPGDVRLTYGREVLDLVVAGEPDATTSFSLAGDGAGDPGQPNRLWPTDDFWAGGAPSPGVGARWRAAHELRSTTDARVAGEAWAARDVAARTPVQLQCWLQPSLGPGDALEVAGAPEDLGLGPIRVRQVVHRVEPGGAAITDVWGAAEAATGIGGLLAMLGSLL